MKTINYEYYVSLEVAKLLKEAGFDWEIKTFYFNNELHETILGEAKNHNFSEVYISAPTLEVAQKWLREVHHLHITIFSSSQESWMFRITKQHQSLEDGVYGEDFYTYEEALEAGIKKALEMIL